MRRETSGEARISDRSAATDRRGTFGVVMERYLLDPDPRALARRGGRFWLPYEENYRSRRTENRRFRLPLVRSLSTRTAGVATMGLSLGTAAAAGLQAPRWVWVVTAIAAAICLVTAISLHLLEGRASEQVLTAPATVRAPLSTAPALRVATEGPKRADEPSVEDVALVETMRALCHDINTFLEDEAQLGIAQYGGRVRGELIARYQQGGLRDCLFLIPKKLQSPGFLAA